MELWGRGDIVLRAVYDALAPFGVPLANLAPSTSVNSAADPALTVKIGDVGTTKFALDRIESLFVNFTEDFFRSIPSILAASTGWVKASVPSLEFASHQFTYFNHSLLKEGKTQEFLAKLNPRTIKSAGESIGNGMIFNQVRRDLGWRSQLLLDRSTIVPDGLFVSLSILIDGDIASYDSLFVEARSYFATALSELDLKVPELLE